MSHMSCNVEELRSAFDNIRKDNQEVLLLLTRVSTHLQTCREIGQSHPLTWRWENICHVSQIYRAV